MRASDLSSHPSWGSRHASLQPVFYMGFGGDSNVSYAYVADTRESHLPSSICVCVSGCTGVHAHSGSQNQDSPSALDH